MTSCRPIIPSYITCPFYHSLAIYNHHSNRLSVHHTFLLEAIHDSLSIITQSVSAGGNEMIYTYKYAGVGYK